MKNRKLHLAAWTLFRPLLMLIRIRFAYRPEICRAKGPLIVLCNHNTDYDPLLLACAFPRQMYFVASAHIFRAGFASVLIRLLAGPIALYKGSTASDTALAMLRCIRQGASVCMFAEGNRSFNGLTGRIMPATAKLVRASGATLVTYRLDGGYFTSPRWCGAKIRRGRMRGTVTGIYPPDQIKAMRRDELQQTIERDLACDAYAEQRSRPVRYRGRHLAEHLERVFWRCPRCGSIGSLHSSGNRITCSCGFAAEYSAYGFLSGDAPADSITAWDAMQTEQLHTHIVTCGDGVIFSDTDMMLRSVGTGSDANSVKELGTGTLTLTRDTLECCGVCWPLTEISGIALHGPQTVDLSSGGIQYEIRSKAVRCTRKYMQAVEYLKQAQRAGAEQA